jgi:1,4-dihydroxy-2-naphthoyl-CoA hydrolase
MGDVSNADRERLIALIEERHPHTALHALGISFSRYGSDYSEVVVDVTERLFQHAGVVHGGVYVLLMESAASVAAAFAVDMTKVRVAGQEMSATHVRASASGRLVCGAKLVHGGKTTMVYQCDCLNDGKLVSTGRCTIAIRQL